MSQTVFHVFWARVFLDVFFFCLRPGPVFSKQARTLRFFNPRLFGFYPPLVSSVPSHSGPFPPHGGCQGSLFADKGPPDLNGMSSLVVISRVFLFSLLPRGPRFVFHGWSLRFGRGFFCFFCPPLTLFSAPKGFFGFMPLLFPLVVPQFLSREKRGVSRRLTL